MNTIKFDKKNTLVIAHRGLSGLEKENTNAAFVAAGNRSYYGIETDIHVTADGKYVAIHDANTGRVEKEKLIIEETDFDTLRALPLCDRDGDDSRVDIRIPTLAEYVRICKKYEKICVLELKQPMEADDITRVIEEYREQDYLDGVVFISFHRQNLDEVRRQLPDASVQLLTGEKQIFTDEFLDELAKCGFDLDIHIFTTTKELVDRIHQRGMKVNVWTCDWLDKAEKLVEWGVDYITTNIFE